MNITFDISLILSVIGCITGFSSLAISFYKFLNEHSRLHISFDSSKCIYFPKIDHYKLSATCYHALVYIRIINKSSYPDVIYSISGTLNDTPIVFSSCDLNAVSLKHHVKSEFEYSTRTFKMTPVFSLPIKLSPFDVWQGYMFVQFFPDTDADTLPLKVTLSTSRKKAYRAKCTLSRFGQ